MTKTNLHLDDSSDDEDVVYDKGSLYEHIKTTSSILRGNFILTEIAQSILKVGLAGQQPIRKQYTEAKVELRAKVADKLQVDVPKEILSTYLQYKKLKALSKESSVLEEQIVKASLIRRVDISACT